MHLVPALLRLLDEVGPLVLMLVVTTALLFAYIAHEILAGGEFSFDKAILVALRKPGEPKTPIGPIWIAQSAIDISALGGFTIMWLLSAALVGLFLLVGRPVEALLFAASVIGSSLLNAGVKYVIARPRPFVVPHLATVSNGSFPSGHAMLSATSYLTLVALTAHTLPDHAARTYIVILGIAVVLLIGASRIYLGVHWPSDVLGGWCLGAAWALVFSVLAGAQSHLPAGKAAVSLIERNAPRSARCLIDQGCWVNCRPTRPASLGLPLGWVELSSEV